MKYVIKCEGLLGMTYGDGDDPTGLFLKRYDPNAREGRGEADWTDDPAKALTFDDAGEALACWNQQSTAMPTRPWDGKPNRPLTAYTISVEKQV